MILEEGEYLAHYGTLHKSGRYPWGSGKDDSATTPWGHGETQMARNQMFREAVTGLKKEGLKDSDIAKLFSTEEHPLTSTDIRNLMSITKSEIKREQIQTAQKLKAKGMSNVAIGKQMGINESSVRSLLNTDLADRNDILQNTANMLRDQIAEKKYIDIGSGTHFILPGGITEAKMKTAIALLREEGYEKFYVQVPQLGTNEKTSIKVLGAPGSKYPKLEEIRGIQEMYTPDGGHTWNSPKPPLSFSSKRLAVRYAEDGGADADGVMYIRPGVKDLSIGQHQYAQVRVMVDGTHYLKGMAVKKDGLPDGVDIVFNTNKENTGNKLDALKAIKDDPALPFGSVVRQITDAKGNPTSVMNLMGQNEGAGVEGGWGTWSKSLSSQVLSKQPPPLAKKQLDLTYDRRKQELDEIMSLTNPAVKKKLLEGFADSTDSAAIHLKAAALPKQSTHVILPVNSMKKTEVYAPNFDQGDRVVLIRYPHGGTFEIPELTVNNKNPEAIKLLGKTAQDAIGIHHSVAEQLSGADFDGDTVLVIPNNHGTIRRTPPLEGLKGFDSKDYKIKDLKTDEHGNIVDSRYMTKSNTQTEMGKITNLISDMTIRGAGREDLSRAIRHSMVVIDANKHELDYKRSFEDHGIAALKKNYQGVSEKGNLKGAATLITRAKSETRVPEKRLRKASEGGHIDPKTGRLVFVDTGKMVPVFKTVKDPVTGKRVKVDTGKTELKRQVSTKLAETPDAHKLVSDANTPIERVYADHSNRMKALANESRKAWLQVTPLPQASDATKKAYAAERDSLNFKLNEALKNAPLERQAQILGNVKVRSRRRASPDLEPSEVRKIKAQELAEARTRTGAKKKRVEITPKEWEAIQAGAISNHKLEQILANSDLDVVKALATPRVSKLMTPTNVSRAQSMLANGATQAEVASALGVSLTTLKESL